MKSGNKNVVKRVFLVGCPRSGTTLLQTRISNHPEIMSFPESHFFSNLYPGNFIKNKVFKMRSGRIKKAFKSFTESISELDRDAINTDLPAFQNSTIKHFVKALDALTIKQGKSVWLEKTPMHLHYIPEIERSIRNVHFLHLIRDGADVVSSLYEVTNKYPHYWYGTKTIEDCISRWAGDVKISKSYQNSVGHTVIKYEDFVEDPAKTLEQIFCQLGVSYFAGKQALHSSSNQCFEEYEVWKRAANQVIQCKPRAKFKQIFTDSEQKYILSKISDIS